ncbi:MAG: pilus assembly PilX family protein [Woeseiaceae bacterium]
MQPTLKLNKQGGAALIVGLVLMVLITALAISGMNTATTELALARNDQIHEYAFQAAETGLEDMLASDSLTTNGKLTTTRTINAQDSVSGEVVFEGWSIVPDKAYSLGTGNGIAAFHFVGTATATSRRNPDTTTNRDAEAVHLQAFYIIGPEPPAL